MAGRFSGIKLLVEIPRKKKKDSHILIAIFTVNTCNRFFRDTQSETQTSLAVPQTLSNPSTVE